MPRTCRVPLAWSICALCCLPLAAQGETIPSRRGSTPDPVFEPNRGQARTGTEFVVRLAGATAHLRGAHARFERAGRNSAGFGVVGARELPLTVEASLPGRSHYLIGDDRSRWVRDVPHASSVRARDVLPGIDLLWHGAGGWLEYDLLLAAGADPAALHLEVDGDDDLEIDAVGRLVQGEGRIVHEAPLAWQEIGGVRRPVAVAFRLLDRRTFGFEVGARDPAQALVIDPVLSFSTFLGGAGDDLATDCELDQDGNVVVAGYTSSVDFPAANGWNSSHGGGPYDAFVTKLAADGSTVLWSTFLGGSGEDVLNNHNIELDASGRVFFSGSTTSSDWPTTAGAFQTTPGGRNDGCFGILSADGRQLVYSTFIGGPGGDVANGMAIHQGFAFFTGGGRAGFPTTPGAYATAPVGDADAFVVCLAPNGNGLADLVYSSLIGGGLSDRGDAIVVDGDGNAHVSGVAMAANGYAAFPVTANAAHPHPLLRRNYNGTTSLHFYASISPLGRGALDLRYSMILENDATRGTSDLSDIAVDAAGRAHLCGRTSDSSWPITANAVQPAFAGGNWDAYYTILDPSLSGAASLVYSTFLGSSGEDAASGIRLRQGRTYLTGSGAYFQAPSGKGKPPTVTVFPTTADALQSTASGYGNWEAFVTVLDPALPPAQQLLFSTLLGASSHDSGRGIVVTANGDIVVTGYTQSAAFPTTGGAFDTTHNGGTDAFVIRLRL